MKLVALIETPDHVCFRYRVGAFAESLAALGIELEAMPLERGMRRVRQFLSLRRADAVLLQRKLLPFWQLQILRGAARRLIYDFDDAVFQRDSYSGKSPNSWMRLMRFWATVYAADAVIAGNDYLRQRVASYIETQRVYTIPTCVTPGRYPLAQHTRSDAAIRLVWIGQQSTLSSLGRMNEHLAAVGRARPGLELRIICNVAAEVPGVRVVPRNWSSATEAAELADGDIGITWLPDDAWSRGKCGLRVLQFLAAGLPVVANPVGMNREQVLPGETGFLASTPTEWAEAIVRLATDPPLRQRMGQAGRRLVEEHFSVARWGRQFAEVVAGTAGPAAERTRDPLELQEREAA